MRSITKTKISVLLCTVAVLLPGGWAADPATPLAGAPTDTTKPADIAKLRAQLDRQQKEIERLVVELAEQPKMLEQAGIGGQAVSTAVAQHTTPADRLMASTTPMLPPPAAAATPSLSSPLPQAPADALPQKGGDDAPSPLQFHLGYATITPIGFMDLTNTWRSTNSGATLATNFGSYPYNNTPQGRLSEIGRASCRERV